MYIRYLGKSAGMGERYNTVDEHESISVKKGQVIFVSDGLGERILEDFKNDFEAVDDKEAVKEIRLIAETEKSESEKQNDEETAAAQKLQEARDRMAKAREAKQEKARNEGRGGK